MLKKQKVAVALSGGVDSSVTASLLLEAGYEVMGITFELWNPDDPMDRIGIIPARYEDAARVAKFLGIPWQLIKLEEDFQRIVLSYYTESLKAGITPNPCILCNKSVKWKTMLAAANEIGADYMATGHYARILRKETTQLHKAIDQNKDQTYFLSMLNQSELEHTLFPLGEFTKIKVRQIAQEKGLPVADRPESQDLCFMGSLDQTEFIKTYAAGIIQAGEIYHVDGHRMGTHPGLVFYTVGQRKGIAIAYHKPLYVIRKEVETNRLIVGEEEFLGRRVFFAGQANWIEGHPPEKSFRASIKIRYRSAEKDASIRIVDGGRIEVETSESIRDITPGQAVVMYQADRCLGMGFIE